MLPGISVCCLDLPRQCAVLSTSRDAMRCVLSDLHYLYLVHARGGLGSYPQPPQPAGWAPGYPGLQYRAVARNYLCVCCWVLPGHMHTFCRLWLGLSQYHNIRFQKVLTTLHCTFHTNIGSSCFVRFLDVDQKAHGVVRDSDVCAIHYCPRFSCASLSVPRRSSPLSSSLCV